MNSIVVALFLTTIVLAKHDVSRARRILDSNENFFNQVNGDIQNITQRLFVSLLKHKYAEPSSNKLYLAMHNDLTGMSEKNYDKYIVMKNLSKPAVDNTIIKKFFSVSAVVKEILFKQIYRIPDIEFYNNNATSDIENSREFADFVKNFEAKINKLDYNDLFKQTPRVEIRNESVPAKKHLKAWRPRAVLGTTRRLYRGSRARISHYPFIASIHVMGQLVCGGSIIDKDLVLTAASCLQLIYNNKFFRENPKSLAVRVGSTYATRSGDLIGAVEVHFYPSYNPENLYHNLAIIRLSRHIRFTSHSRRLKKIVLDKNEGVLPANVPSILMLGWGATDKTNIVGLLPKMSVSVLDVYHLEECKDVYSRYYVTDKHFCAGFVSKGGGACNKDAGGPGVVGGLLTGVISFGPPACGTADAPTVFTRVGYYIDWIEEIMEQPRIIQLASTTLHPQPTYTRIVTPYIPTRGPVYPIALRNGPKPSMEAILLKQILNEVIFSKSDVLNELLYVEPDWGEDDFNDMFTTRSPADFVPPSTVLPDDVLYGPMDVDDVFTTTQKPNILDHPLINKSLVFIPEKYGIHETTQPASLGLPTLSSSHRPWMTTPPIVDEETTVNPLLLRTNMGLERNFDSETFSNDYEDNSSDSDDGGPNTNDFLGSENRGDTKSMKQESLREQPHLGKNKKAGPSLKYTLPDESGDTDEVYSLKTKPHKFEKEGMHHLKNKEKYHDSHKYKQLATKSKIVGHVHAENTEVENGSENKHHAYSMKDVKFKKTAPVDSESADEDYATKNMNDEQLLKEMIHHEKHKQLGPKLKNTSPVEPKHIREQRKTKNTNHESDREGSNRGDYDKFDTNLKNIESVQIRDTYDERGLNDRNRYSPTVDAHYVKHKKLEPVLTMTTPIESENTDEEYGTINRNPESLREDLHRDKKNKIDTNFKDRVVFESESKENDLRTKHMNHESFGDNLYRDEFNQIDTKLTNKVVFESESNEHKPNNNERGSSRQLKYEGDRNFDNSFQNVLRNDNHAIEGKREYDKLRFNADGSPNAEFKNIQEPTNNNIKRLSRDHISDSKEIRLLLNNLGSIYTPTSVTEGHIDHGARIGRTMIVNTIQMDKYVRGTEPDKILKS